MRWLMFLSLFGLCTCIASECPAEDNNIYLFGIGFEWGQYEYINDDGELEGFGYDIARSVCRAMNKKCKFTVSYNYDDMWDGTGKSIALNNGWYAAALNYIVTAKRKSVYSFFGTYANEAPAYMYIRRGHSMDTVDEIRRNGNKFGFRTGFRTGADCLANYLGISLAGKSFAYPSLSELERALINRDVDVIFVDQVNYFNFPNRDDIEQVGNEPIACAMGGLSCMTRKDQVGRFAWFEEGVKKIQANGDYGWLCNINSRDYDIGCFD